MRPLRRVMAVRGDARVEVALEPAAGFGRHRLNEAHRHGDGTWTGRTGSLRMRWSGAGAARMEDGRLSTVLELPAGTQHDLVLELSDRPLPPEQPDPAVLWSGTEGAWHDSVPTFDASAAPADTRHSYAVLRGMTGSAGGMVAAATTSLPERAAQGRNYDYRYVWIRDQCYAGQAVAADGPHPLLDDAVAFDSARIFAARPQNNPPYTPPGGHDPHERRLDIPGYPGGWNVVGNHVNAQFQLDAFGEALLLFAAAARHDRLDSQHWSAVTAAVAAIEKRWREPDAGIWELTDRRWAHSRLICAAGLRAMSTCTGGPTAASWSTLADAIVADSADCVHPTGRWQRAPDDPQVDASLLLPALRGALPASDARSTATYRAIAAELVEDGYVYRFRQDPRPLGEAEGAFALCGFVMALAAQQQGDRIGAARLFERNRAACGPPGLYAEEYDVLQKQLRGNLPQAFVHALMLEASVRLTLPWSASSARAGPPPSSR
jgi:GH15 family glucan-1,4-alpha-glucosidase